MAKIWLNVLFLILKGYGDLQVCYSGGQKNMSQSTCKESGFKGYIYVIAVKETLFGLWEWGLSTSIKYGLSKKQINQIKL